MELSNCCTKEGGKLRQVKAVACASGDENYSKRNGKLQQAERRTTASIRKKQKNTPSFRREGECSSAMSCRENVAGFRPAC